MLNVKKLLTKILSLTPTFEYVGNMNPIHWSSWTATDDGIIIADIGFITGGGTGYYYVKDTTANLFVLKITTSNANGTQQTRCFPVIKGHTYKVDNYDRVNGSALIFNFYKMKLGGGYFLKVFSRLAERRWEYAEYKENSHQTDAYDWNKLHHILRSRCRVGFAHFVGNMGVHILVWNNLFCRAESNYFKGRKRIITDKYYYGRENNNTSDSKLLFYGKLKDHRLVGDRQDLTISERGWSCA